MSIRTRLILLVALATLPLLILSGVRYLVDRNEAISATEIDLKHAAEATASQLASAVTGAQLLLFGLAHPLAPELLIGGSVCTAFLAQVRDQSPLYANVSVVATNGDSICDALGTRFADNPLNVSYLPLFQRALQVPGKPVAEARIGNVTRTGVVNVVFPVRSDDEVALLLVASLDLGLAARPSYGTASIRDYETLIVSNGGQVLLWVPADGRVTGAGASIIDTPIFRRALGDASQRVIEVAGVPYVWTSGFAVPGMDAGSPRILLGVPKASLTSAADERFAQDLFVLAIVAVLLLVTTVLVAEIAVRQLARIHSAVRRLVTGDLSARISGRYPRGELGDLMAKLDGTITQFAAIIESSPASLVCINREGRVTLWNVVAARLSGIPASEALGSELRLLPGKFAAILRETFWKVLRGSELEVADLTIPVDAEGSRTVAIRAGLLRQGDEHEAVGVLILTTDVTEHRMLQAQLFQAQKLEALGHLTGGIAHDFNNLLTAIMGNSALLMDRVAEDKLAHEIAESTLIAARHGAELTKSLLAFAKRQPLAPRAIDVGELLHKMEGLLQRTLGGRIVCELRFASGPHRAMVDPAKLESAILNLVTNSRDAMENGGTVVISVEKARLASDAGERDVINVTVADDGAGMSEETLRRVFEPFYTTKAHGTGLGMPMVYGFLKQSGGEIHVESKVGLGTVVHLQLPATSRPVEASDAQAVQASHGNGEVVLVVEDDPRVRRYAELQFEALGYTVIGVPSSAEALVVLRSPQHVDLLFTDLMLPGRYSGDQLVDAALGLRPSLPVLFASGSPEAAAALQRRRGADVAFLAKPYERIALARAVRGLLDAAESRAGAAE